MNKIMKFFWKFGRYIKARYIFALAICRTMKIIIPDLIRHMIAWDISDGEQAYNEVCTDRYLTKLEDECIQWMLTKFGWTEKEWEKARFWG